MRNRIKTATVAALAALLLPYGGAVSAAPAPASTPASAQAPVTVLAAESAKPPTSAPAAISSAGTAFKQVLAGTYYSVALRADGTVWTWGRDLWGELGVLKDNVLTSVAAPVRLPNLSGISAIATNGDGMQVGVKRDGTVLEWGSIAGLKASIRDSELPRQVAGLKAATAAVALASAGAAMTADGGLSVWTHDAATGETKVTPLKGAYKWSSLTSCGNAAYALDAAGNVWGFGARLEKDGSTSVLQPVRQTGLPVLKQLTGCASGIDRSGAAWTWELMPNQAYVGDKLTLPQITGKPARVHPELKAKAIAGGPGLLLTESGDVWMLGKGPTGKPGKVKGLSGIVSIAAGPYHFLAIDATGRIWGWGADNWNETGIVRPHGDGMVYAPKPIQPAINVYVNGKLLVAPFPARIDNGSASVPMRAVLQALGGSFSTGGGYSISIAYRQKTATLLAGGKAAEIDGKQTALPDIIQAFSGVEMIPVSLLKLLGVHAAWDGKLGELRLSGG